MNWLLTTLCGVLVIVGIWRLAYPAFDSKFRHVFPIPSTFMLVGAVLATAMVACLLFTLPPFVIGFGLAVMAIAVATAALKVLDRIRHHPPGRRSIVTSTRDLVNRDSYTHRFDKYGPITLSSQFGRPVVCVFGLERGQRLLREHRHAIGPSPLAFSQQMMGGFLRYMDDETHDKYGPLFRRAMSRAVTDATQPFVETSTRRLFILPESPRLDPRGPANELAQDVLLKALFGVDPNSEVGKSYLDALRSFSRHAIHHRWNTSARRDLDRARDLVDRTARSALDSSFPSALSEMRGLDPDQPDSVAIDNLLFMWRIGSANTAALLLWTLQHIGGSPEMCDRLRLNEPGLADAVVMETLRLSQSEYVYRKVKRAIDFEGCRLERDWMIRICVAESHVDPSNFSCPHAFTDRFLGERPSHSQYAPFGFDRHACNSGGLASAIIATALTTILADDRISVIPSTSLQRDFRHWSHWRPGADLAIIRAMS